MKRFGIRSTTSLIALLTVALTNIMLSSSVGAAAFNGTIQQGANSAHGNGQPNNLFGSAGVFTTITNVLLYIVGAISVIMIIIGGIRYIVSGGNSNNVTEAKNTILYAVVGIVIAVLGYAIVNFVIGSFSTGGNGVGGSGSGF